MIRTRARTALGLIAMRMRPRVSVTTKSSSCRVQIRLQSTDNIRSSDRQSDAKIKQQEFVSREPSRKAQFKGNKRTQLEYPERKIFSGIQPTGVPHLGNYLGALRTWKDLQDEKASLSPVNQQKFNLLFSVVDLHALTGEQSRVELARHRKETFASLLAIGLGGSLSDLFLQSSIHEHTELMWILSTVASTGYLSRMTQWKTKLKLPDNATLGDDKATQNLRLGLFSYPVLQAADILLYRPTEVPVGEDQSQHIEFTRQLAKSFNALCCKEEEPFFPNVDTILSPAKRVMSLKDPTKKMSKSDSDPKSRILITDPPELIKAKVRGAVTDSESGIAYDPKRRPGTSNLIEILKHVTRSTDDLETIGKDHRAWSKVAFKDMIADEVIKELDGVRDNFRQWMRPGNQDFMNAFLKGRAKARSRAANTMRALQPLIGLEDWTQVGGGKAEMQGYIETFGVED